MHKVKDDVENCNAALKDNPRCLVRDRICKRLWSPGIDSEESMPLAYVAWRAGIWLSYWSARLGIDFWAPLRVHKYGLRLTPKLSTPKNLAKPVFPKLKPHHHD